MRVVTANAMVTACYAYLKLVESGKWTKRQRRRVTQLHREARRLHQEEIRRATGRLFAGAYYDPALDDERLTRQIGRVFEAMADGKERTLAEISRITGDPVASVDAQLRHLRKPQHGEWIVDTIGYGNGLFTRRLRNPDGTLLSVVGPRPKPRPRPKRMIVYLKKRRKKKP